MKKIVQLTFLVGIFIRLVYFFLIPLGQAPDEIFHFERIYLTAISPNFVSIHPNSEYVQPPFYYWLFALITSFILKLKQAVYSNIPEPFFQLGLFLRIINFFISIATLFCYHLFLKQLKLDKTVYLGSLFILFFLPTLAGNAVIISSDSLVLLLISIILIFFPSLVKKNQPKRSYFLIGILTGLAVLTKLFSLGLIFSVVYLILKKESKKNWQALLVFLTPVVLIAGWWFIDNRLNYGGFLREEIVEISNIGMIKPFTIPNYLFIFFWWTFQTFIMTFGVTNNIRLADSLYLLMALFFTFSLTNYFKIKKINNQILTPILKALAIFALINFSQLMFLNLKFILQPQGRYLYNALPFFALVLSIGWLNSFPKKYKFLGLFCLVLIFIGLNLLSFNCLLAVYWNKEILPFSAFCYFSY